MSDISIKPGITGLNIDKVNPSKQIYIINSAESKPVSLGQDTVKNNSQSSASGKAVPGEGIVFDNHNEDFPLNYPRHCSPDSHNFPYDPGNNSCHDSNYEPNTPREMRIAYGDAMSRKDGYSLIRLAKVENEKQLLPDVKAGDILYNAYKGYPHLLYNVATFENSVDLMNLKAGDILDDGYKTALANRDISTLYRIADYEQENDLMNITAEEIRRQAANIEF